MVTAVERSASDPFGLLGQVLDGQYRVDQLVGEGGFSAVYQGHNLGLNEPIAIKCLKLPPELGPSLVETFVQRFRDESRILYRLSQGNLHIVRSIAAGRATSPEGLVIPYMVLEWLEGRSLANDFTVRRTLGETGRPLDQVLKLFKTAAEALAFAHGQGVVHRDLNPGNLFLASTSKGFTMKVLDFGVAKVMHDSTLGLGPRAQTSGQIRVFAPAYGAPEQFDDRFGAVTSAADVYSFALVLLEALRDRPVHEGANVSEYAKMAFDGARRPTPRTLGISVADAVETVFARATKLDPRERYKTVGEFWTALEGAIAGQRGAAMKNLPSMQRTLPLGAVMSPLRPPVASRAAAKEEASPSTHRFPSRSAEDVPRVNQHDPNKDGDEPEDEATQVKAPEPAVLKTLAQFGPGSNRPPRASSRPPRASRPARASSPARGESISQNPPMPETQPRPAPLPPARAVAMPSRPEPPALHPADALEGTIMMPGAPAPPPDAPPPLPVPPPAQNMQETLQSTMAFQPGGAFTESQATLPQPTLQQPNLPPPPSALPQPNPLTQTLAFQPSTTPGPHGMPPQGSPVQQPTPYMGQPMYPPPQGPPHFDGGGYGPQFSVQPAPAAAPKSGVPVLAIVLVVVLLLLGVSGVAVYFVLNRRVPPDAAATAATATAATTTTDETAAPPPSAAPSATVAAAEDPAPSAGAATPAPEEAPAPAPVPEPTAAGAAPTPAAATPAAATPKPAIAPAPQATGQAPTAMTAVPKPVAVPTGTATPAPVKSATAAPADSSEFNEPAARARLNQANGVLAFCKKGETSGPGVASVTFGTEGTVTNVVLEPPYAGTREGDCVIGQFKRQKVAPFRGLPQTLRHSFSVPK